MLRILLLLGFFSCGGEVSTEIGAGGEYSFTIEELNSFGDVIVCSSFRSGEMRSNGLCKAIKDEFLHGSCDRNCAALLYQSAGCGDLVESFNSNMNCSNKLKSN